MWNRRKFDTAESGVKIDSKLRFKGKKIKLILANLIVLILFGIVIYSVSNNNGLVKRIIRQREETEITYELDPAGYTNKNMVNVFIKLANSNGIKTIQYLGEDDKIIANGRTNVGIDYKLTKNGTYSFKITDVNDKEKTQDIIIDAIDTVEPKTSTIEAQTIGETKIRVKLGAEDGDETEESVKSGIEKYEIYVNGGKVGESTEDLYIIKNLRKNTTYSIYQIAYDKAGNSKKSETITVTTTEGEYPTIMKNTINFPDEVLLASNAIEIESCDNNEETSANYSNEALAYVDESAWKRILKVKYNTFELGNNIYVRALIMVSYDESNNLISRAINPGAQTGVKLDYEFEIPEGCKKIRFYLSEGGNFHIYNIEIKENEELGKDEGTYRSLIPVMQNTTVKNGVVVDTSDQYNGWACNAIDEKTGWSTASGNYGPHYFVASFAKPVVVQKYEINGLKSWGALYSFCIQASKDKENWIDLENEIHQTDGSSKLYSTEIDNQTAYKYYRIYLPTGGWTYGSSGGWVGLIKLYGI